MFQETAAAPIRFPSTANLNINSSDRLQQNNNITNASSADFTITKQGNILSGYFTRFGVCELVLDWFIPNVNALYNHNKISVSFNGSAFQEFKFDDGFYTVESLMNKLVSDLNDFFSGAGFFIDGTTGNHNLQATAAFTIGDTPLARSLSFKIDDDDTINNFLFPNLLINELQYLDFTCSNLTYQQGLKDADTSAVVRDVLYRWHFAWDSPPQLDGLGYPILQGYTPFLARRYLNYPKQIRWDTQQPIGQLAFQVFNSDGQIVRYTGDSLNVLSAIGSDGFEWSMNILVSEQ